VDLAIERHITVVTPSFVAPPYTLVSLATLKEAVVFYHLWERESDISAQKAMALEAFHSTQAFQCLSV
jgi:hypothetical protein